MYKGEAIAHLDLSAVGSSERENKTFAHYSNQNNNAATEAFLAHKAPDDANAGGEQQQPMPRWTQFLQNNVMCFCDPLFVAVHTMYHLAHFCYLAIRYLSCSGQPVGIMHPHLDIMCQFGGKPWLAYEELYLSFVLSGSPTFTFVLLFSCFIHEGGVFVGVSLATFKRFKWHGICLALNLALLLPPIITHSIPMIVIYSPFVLALCACLAALVLGSTWLMNYLWDRMGMLASLQQPTLHQHALIAAKTLYEIHIVTCLRRMLQPRL